MRYFKFSFLLSIVVALVLGLAVPASAQEDTGTLCVRVYADRNANGFFDSGERLVEGAVVKLSSPTLDHPATYTTGISDHPECVDALPPDLYTVSVKPPEGATATTPTELQIQVNANEKVTVEVGVTAQMPFEAAAICASIFNDLDGNGIVGAGDEWVKDGTIALTDLHTPAEIGIHITDGSEPFCFEGLAAGDYRVSIELPEGWESTTQPEWSMTLSPGATADLQFGAQRRTVGASGPEYPYNDLQFWLGVALMIGMAITPFLALASLILNIIILRRLGRVEARGKDDEGQA